MTKLRGAAGAIETVQLRKTRTKAKTDWDAVKQDYVSGQISVTAIAAKHATTRTDIYLRRKTENWPRRSLAGNPGGCKVSPSKSRRKTIAERLMALIEKQLMQMEADMAEEGDEPISPADNERRARAVSNLTRSFEQAAELSTDDRSKRARDGAPERAGAGDTLRLRRDLANRIAKLGDRLRREHDRG